MIKFQAVRWKNFLSTGNYFTEIQLDRNPTTLVVGVNGGGKSTMLDALCFALFGKPFRKINRGDLINSINGRECVAEVDFEIHNVQYHIVRGLNPQIFAIYVDGKLLNQDGASKDQQLYLERHILKFNYKAFTQIVILGASSFVPFMRLPAWERRTIIEDLLDINIFSVMNKVVKMRLDAFKLQATEVKSELESTMAKIDMQKKYVEEAKKTNQEQITNKQLEIESNEQKIFDALAEISKINDK